ncbi:hypothetical protein V6R21_19395 [Limibacter armeniacum]|uniref:hypothetical protein n=1 Tax=Limibacter armeniacum TaxID=466084 RepID=UPI002FE5A1F3
MKKTITKSLQLEIVQTEDYKCQLIVTKKGMSGNKEYNRQKILVFEDDVEAFEKVLQRAISMFQREQREGRPEIDQGLLVTLKAHN